MQQATVDLFALVDRRHFLGVPPGFRQMVALKPTKLTKTAVDAIGPDGRDRIVWDAELKRFGVRVTESGKKTYVLQYKAGGATRRYTISATNLMAPAEAREIARRKLAEIAQGADPSAEKKAARSKPKELNVADLCSLYLEAAQKGLVKTRFGKPKAGSTVQWDQGRIERHIVPLIGKIAANSLTRADCQRMVDDIALGKTAGVFKTGSRGKAVVEGGAGTASRVAGLLGGIYSWAEKRDHVSVANPARGLEKHRDQMKDRTLARDELRRLGETIEANAERYPLACYAVRLIALTGARREEIVGLRWREIDFDGSCLRLEESKTGRSQRPLGKSAVELLRTIQRDAKLSDEFVFPSRDNQHSADLKKSIAAIFDDAGLKDARSHDLRRTFASTAAELGYSDATIAELIGHARRGVTERHYVRRPDAVLITAASNVARVIERAMSGESGVITLDEHRNSL